MVVRLGNDTEGLVFLTSIDQARPETATILRAGMVGTV